MKVLSDGQKDLSFTYAVQSPCMLCFRLDKSSGLSLKKFSGKVPSKELSVSFVLQPGIMSLTFFPKFANKLYSSIFLFGVEYFSCCPIFTHCDFDTVIFMFFSFYIIPFKGCVILQKKTNDCKLFIVYFNIF